MLVRGKMDTKRSTEVKANNVQLKIFAVYLAVGNIIWVIGIIFTMGIAYSQIGQLGEDIEVLEQRLEKKIKVINDCQEDIKSLELELAKMANCKHKK